MCIYRYLTSDKKTNNRQQHFTNSFEQSQGKSVISNSYFKRRWRSHPELHSDSLSSYLEDQEVQVLLVCLVIHPCQQVQEDHGFVKLRCLQVSSAAWQCLISFLQRKKNTNSYLECLDRWQMSDNREYRWTTEKEKTCKIHFKQVVPSKILNTSFFINILSSSMKLWSSCIWGERLKHTIQKHF